MDTSNIGVDTRKPYEAPFRYDRSGQMVWDKNDMWCLTLRGWGHLTGTGGGLGIDEETAAELQDQFGEMVVKMLNENAEKEPKMKTLPNDVARCKGALCDTGWRAGCETCLRRIAERPDRYILIGAPELVDGKCPVFIDSLN